MREAVATAGPGANKERPPIPEIARRSLPIAAPPTLWDRATERTGAGFATVLVLGLYALAQDGPKPSLTLNLISKVFVTLATPLAMVVDAALLVSYPFVALGDCIAARRR